MKFRITISFPWSENEYLYILNKLKIIYDDMKHGISIIINVDESGESINIENIHHKIKNMILILFFIFCFFTVFIITIVLSLYKCDEMYISLIMLVFILVLYTISC